ncbi:hypothetical protein N185_15830 [Sinorhizobium sp. GW3]|nr:hypothetical protein N185_15830 [Sinorhizobium sp. GW3]
MRIWFCMMSEVLSSGDLVAALGCEPDRVFSSGQRINNASLRTHKANRVKRLIYEGRDSLAANVRMREILTEQRTNFSIGNTFIYFDISIEDDGVDGDFLIQNDILKKLSVLDVQIQLEVERS